MALNIKQEKILSEAKAKMKIMGQVSKLEKDISALDKKVEIKQKKLSELINILDGKNTADIKPSEKRIKENGKLENSSDLLFEG